MSAELESIVWCPSCKEDRGEIRRVPADKPGVFMNVTTPSPLPKFCAACGTIIERKPPLIILPS